MKEIIMLAHEIKNNIMVIKEIRKPNKIKINTSRNIMKLFDSLVLRV